MAGPCSHRTTVSRNLWSSALLHIAPYFAFAIAIGAYATGERCGRTWCNRAFPTINPWRFYWRDWRGSLTAVLLRGDPLNRRYVDGAGATSPHHGLLAGQSPSWRLSNLRSPKPRWVGLWPPQPQFATAKGLFGLMIGWQAGI